MKIYKRIASSSFLRSNAILLAGALGVGVLNYAFYLVIGRLLQPAAFGEVQAILSLFLQVTIFLIVVNVVTVYVVVNYPKATRRNATILELEKLALLIAGILLVALFVFGEPLRQFFHFGSVWPFVLLGIMLLLTVPFTFRTSYLRGKQKFMASTAAQLIAAGGKFVFSVPLILIGLSTGGALIGVAAAQAVALGHSAWQARLAGLRRPKSFKLFAKPNLAIVWPELKYSFFVLLGSLAVMLLLTLDALAVKRFFDAHTAGLYAGIATVSRMIFFATASITQAMLPALKVDAPRGHNRNLLIKSLVLFAGLGLPALLVFCVFPHQAIAVLMGPDYTDMADLLPLLSVTIFTISLINLLVSYFLALKHYIVGMFVIMGFAAAIGLMLIHHASPQAIVESLFVGSVVSMCLIAVWWSARAHLDRRSNDETTTTLHRGPGA